MLILIPEIRNLVYSNLNRKELFKCMNVCKQMRKDILPLFYYRVSVWNLSHKRFLELLLNTANTDGTRIGDYVREIEFHSYTHKYECDCVLIKEEFHRLVELIPHVRKIMLKDNRYFVYADYLQTVPLHQLKYLQEIVDSSLYQVGIEKTVLASFYFKDRIQTLYYTETLMNDDANVLSEFTSLKNLHMQDFSKLDVIQILDACRNRLNTLTHCSFSRATTMSTTTTYTNLKTLEITADNLTTENVKWLMQYVPNLNTLSITFEDRHVLAFLDSLDTDCAKKFYGYIKQIPNVNLHSKHSTDMTHSTDPVLDFIQRINCPHYRFHFKINRITTEPEFENFALKKQGNSLEINNPQLLHILENPYASNLLDSLSISSVTILVGRSSLLVENQRIKFNAVNSGLIALAITLLKQVLKTKSLPLILKNHQQRLYFHSRQYKMNSGINDLDLLPMATASDFSPIRCGYVMKILLTNELLCSLSELYPSLTELVLEECKTEHSQRSKLCILNLSYFSNMDNLTFDIHTIKNRRRSKRPVYLVFFDVTAPLQTQCYYVNQRNQNILQYMENQDESSIPQSAYVFKILCRRQIENISFTKRERNRLKENLFIHVKFGA